MRGSAGGLVLLGAGVMILLMFFTGRLEWLFALGRDVNAARVASDGSSGVPAAVPGKPSAPPIRPVWA